MRSAQLALDETDHGGLHAFARRQIGRVIGVALFLLVAFGVASLATWNVADPSFSHASANPVTNAMGYPGAVFSDLAIQFFGLSSVAALVPAVLWGFFLFTGRSIDRMPKRAGAWFAAALFGAAITGCVTPPPTWPLPSGLGGVFGDMILKIPALAIGQYPTGLAASIVALLLAGPTLWLYGFGAALLARRHGFEPSASPRRKAEEEAELLADDDDEDSEGILALGAIAHWWLSAKGFVRRRIAAHRRMRELDEEDALPIVERRARNAGSRIEPDFAPRPTVREPVLQIDDDEFDEDLDGDILPATEMARRLAPANAGVGQAARVAAPAPRPARAHASSVKRRRR